jgi:hypothetical protein
MIIAPTTTIIGSIGMVRTVRGSPNVKVALVSGYGPTSSCG